MRQRVRPFHSSILPYSFQSRKSRSICQRARCNTSTSLTESFSRGTLVSKSVHLARAKDWGLACACPIGMKLRKRWEKTGQKKLCVTSSCYRKSESQGAELWKVYHIWPTFSARCWKPKPTAWPVKRDGNNANAN